jgi:hypothetical protein
VSESDIEENETANTTRNLLKRNTNSGCQPHKNQTQNSDEDDNDDSIKLRSGRRVRFED